MSISLREVQHVFILIIIKYIKGCEIVFVGPVALDPKIIGIMPVDIKA